MPTRLQTIVWTKDGIVNRRIYVALGHNELKDHLVILPAWSCKILELNTLKTKYNGKHFADDIFKYIYFLCTFMFWLIAPKLNLDAPNDSNAALDLVRDWKTFASTFLRFFLILCWRTANISPSGFSCFVLLFTYRFKTLIQLKYKQPV